MSFDDLGLIEPLLKAIRKEGYKEPTPIQEQAIPHLLEGKDLLACAQTGTGKTAAFALPILQNFHENPTPLHAPAQSEQGIDGDPGEQKQDDSRSDGRGRRGKGRRRGKKKSRPPKPIRCLILSPTRELAQQIGDSFEAYGHYLNHIHYTTIYGGVRQRSQVRDLKKGVDIVVATPGRLMDLMQQGWVHLDTVETFVLDEADRMLDMGFIEDIRRIASALPSQRQTLLFSATIPQAILSLAHSILTEPEEIRIAPETPTAENVDQRVYFVESRDKQLLLEHLLKDEDVSRALVFAGTKRRADILTNRLQRLGIDANAIHSDKTQGDRKRALRDFREGDSRVLIASDIAARGLDVDDITHVINYDMPNEPETYVHRIGRTARAGASGHAWSFCALEERPSLSAIEALVNMEIKHVEDHPFASMTLRRSPSAGRAGKRRHKVRRNLLRGRRR
ncbi:MAG: DEAD/DEAH box helicase [Phycisphaerae bacterium]